MWTGRVIWDLCSVPGASKGIHQNPRASNWLLKRSQTSKYANSLIQHLSTYLKLDGFLSAFMSGSQDNKGTQQIRSFSPGLKSTATSARTRQQPSSNSWSSFPSHVSQAARATKFAALVTSMLVLVAPSCQPGPVTPLLFILNECIHEYKKEGVTHLSEKMERTFSFWIFNYQLSVSLRRTHTSSLSALDSMIFFFVWVMVYFAQQLLGGSKAVNPVLNPDCPSVVPSCENKTKQNKSWLLHWLLFPSLEAISFCS